MDIRIATENDFIEILYITKGFQELVPTANNLNWSFGEPSENQLIEAIAENNMYIASENLILGVLQLKKAKNANNEDYMQIQNFAIHPIGDRKNLGIFILEFAIEEARKQAVTTLSINVSNNHSRCIEILNILGFTNHTTDNSMVLQFNKKISFN